MDVFREWLSDNLRYIALIAAILVVVLGLGFGVRAITKKGNTQETQNISADSNGNPATVTSAASTKQPTPTVGAKKEETELIGKDGKLTDYAEQSVESVINTYYTALNTRNTDTVRALTDNLSEEDIAAIETSQTSYSDLSVISRNGLTGDGKTAVAFVEYNYQNPDQAIAHAGLSWLYTQYNEAEKVYKIMVNAADDPAISDYVKKLTEEADIAAMIERVQTEAAAADANEPGVPEEAQQQNAEDAAAAAAQAEADAAAAAAQAEADAAAAAAQAEADAAAAAAQGEADAAAAQAEADAAAAAAQAEADAAAAAEGGEPEEAEPSEEELPVGEGEYRAEILETCNVRSGAGYEYAVVTVVEQGDSVVVLGGEDGGWYLVRTAEGEGYIGKRFINAQ